MSWHQARHGNWIASPASRQEEEEEDEAKEDLWEGRRSELDFHSRDSWRSSSWWHRDNWVQGRWDDAPAAQQPAGYVEHAPALPLAQQRQAPERAREQAPPSPATEQRHAAGAPPAAPEPAERVWGASNFVTALLPQHGRAVADMRLCTTLRDLLEAAHAHRAHLPLPADLFFNGDIRVALGCPDAFLVTLEIINGIRDPNRTGLNRIEMLAYRRCGAVTRYHPGGTPKQSAQPHTIPHGSRTYSRAIALEQGIGAALHVHAPGLAAA